MEPAVFAGLVRLAPTNDETLVVQLYRALREAAATGRLAADDPLPSSRAAAALLGVSRNTVNAAYDLLAAEGVIVVRPGTCPRVGRMPQTAEPPAPVPLRLSRRGNAALVPIRRGRTEGRLAPGWPDPALFPADDWGRCLRRAARHRQDGAEGYAHYGGVPELRRVLADQLHRHRGIAADPDDIVVTPGTQASLALAASVFADPGDVALVESPGYSGARAAFAAAGLTCTGLPVDGEGADPAAIGGSGARLVYVTPSTQFPTGVRMTLPRRIALRAAARASGAIVLEDDYDSEFVWIGRGIAALAALPDGGAATAAGPVVYLGSAAKSLLPGLRIGWMVAPRGLADPLRAMQARLGLTANVHAQAALVAFMATGAYRAHLGRVSRVYRDRLGLLTDALRARLGDRVRLSLPEGGLQLVVGLPGTADDGPILARMASAGFAVSALSDHCIGAPRQGLIAGFGTATARDAQRFAAVLEQALAKPDPPPLAAATP